MDTITLEKSVLEKHTTDAVEKAKTALTEEVSADIQAVKDNQAKFQKVLNRIELREKQLESLGAKGLEKMNKLKRDKDLTQYIKNVFAGAKGAEMYQDVASYKLVMTSQDIGAPDDRGTFYTVFPEFVEQIFEDMCREGALRQWLTVRSTMAQLINIQTDILDAQATHVDECSPKSVTSIAIGRVQIQVSKVAAIMLACDELLADTKATDFTGYLSRKLADAFRRLENKDILLADGAGFMGTSTKWFGILNATTANGFTTANGWKNNGINEVVLASTSIGDITVDDLNSALYCIDSCSETAQAAWYMNRKTFLAIANLKDLQGQYLVTSPRDGTDRLLLGYPVRFVDEMPVPTYAGGVFAPNPDTPFILFGDLRNTIMAMREDLNFSTSNQATVTDGVTTYNTWQDNITALRAETRYGVQQLKPSAYSVIRTAV